MKRPDRFQKMVNQWLINNPEAFASLESMSAGIAALLRRQHAAVVRVVKKKGSDMEAIMHNEANSYDLIAMARYTSFQCRNILLRFNKRRR